jgi:hypothetical protein
MDNLKNTTVSRQVLEETPGRVLSFLQAAGTVPPIAALLATRGYTADEHREGWALLHRVAGYERTPTADAGKEVSAAIAELDAWDEPNFRIIEATLDRSHAEQAAFVFHDLAPATGALAVLSVKTLLDRLDVLEDGVDRAASRKADHAALKRLEKKGYTKEERQRLRGLIKTAERVADLSDAPSAIDTARERDLEKLRAWYVEWAETARAVISRRDHLIRLGLAKRKSAKKGKPLPAPSHAPGSTAPEGSQSPIA